jgi:hypothetical protein
MRRVAGWLVLGGVALAASLMLSGRLSSPPPAAEGASARNTPAPAVLAESPGGRKNNTPEQAPTPAPTDTPPDATPTPVPTPVPTPTPPPAVIVPGTLPPLGATGAGTISTPAGLSSIPATTPTTVPQNNGSNPTPLVLLGILVLAVIAVAAFAFSLTLR